ncbi:MAG: SDR family NAD(P)-dependent oxidoreductase, partial [Betaproteobacteria bacterium]
MRLDGKSAIVTGGGSGFGEGIVKKFIAEGARVLIADRDETNAKRVAQTTGASWLRVDVTRSADVKAMLDAAQTEFGDLNILVNNAGVGHLPQPLEGLTE